MGTTDERGQRPVTSSQAPSDPLCRSDEHLIKKPLSRQPEWGSSRPGNINVHATRVPDDAELHKIFAEAFQHRAG